VDSLNFVEYLFFNTQQERFMEALLP